MTDKKLKIGIIGTGSISESHMKAYKNNPGVELYAFCDLSESRACEKSERYGVKHIFTDAGEMLKLPEIDAVSICTWNEQHAPCAIAALNAGKHVLCEKPTAMSAKEAKAMKEAAEKNGKLLMIGFVRRHGNDCDILQDLIKSGYLGELYYAKATYLRKYGSPGGWFGEKELSGGGPLIDLGVHVIDLAKYLMGNPRPISVYGVTFNKLGDRRNIKGKKIYRSESAMDYDVFNVEDLASAMIRFDNGAVLSVETSYSLHTKKDEAKIELFGTRGGAKLDPDLEVYSEINDYMMDMTPDADTAFNFDEAFQKEIDHFVDCMTKDIPCKATAQDGIEIMKILDAIYQSAETGHEVIVKYATFKKRSSIYL